MKERHLNESNQFHLYIIISATELQEKQELLMFIFKVLVHEYLSQVCMHACVCVYIYIYIDRERERERCVCVCVCVCV